MIFSQNRKNCSKKRHQQRYRPHTADGGNVEHYQIPRTSPGFSLLRRQSSQPGPHWSRRGLRKQDSSYGPRGRCLGRSGQASVPANLPDHPHPIHPPGYAVSNALRTSAQKCAGAPYCARMWEPHTSLYVGWNTL
ncbi:hypothetical protein TNCV_3696741 [Trichonephila clavipes]|uniref:Uncharacterized protein n=1 Tax=Trichonephila clavipes TaxID=2585209 RepID=A0A8X6V992_TRICX|nr:hypothetical protein TNCV_3696741 [Trichonephila clavipes]